MKRGDATLDGDGLVKRGDVAEADDWTGVGADGVVVNAVEDAHGAVAAASEEEGIEVVRPQVTVQLCKALRIVAGEITAVAMIDVRSERDAQSSLLERSRRRFDAR